MSRFEILITAFSFFLTVSVGEALKCYHCFDAFKKPLSLGSVDGANFGDRLVSCGEDKNNWNSWDCPSYWPVCVIVYGKVKDRQEIVRTCAAKDFCSSYIPPANVRLDYCQECNTTLCNDYKKLPDPPAQSGPLFTFNVNIHLNLKKYPIVNDKSAS